MGSLCARCAWVVARKKQCWETVSPLLSQVLYTEGGHARWETGIKVGNYFSGISLSHKTASVSFGGRKEERHPAAFLLPNLKWETLPRCQCLEEDFHAANLILTERRWTQAAKKSLCLREGWIATILLSLVFPGCCLQLLSSQRAGSCQSHSGIPNSPFTMCYIIFCRNCGV